LALYSLDPRCYKEQYRELLADPDVTAIGALIVADLVGCLRVSRMWEHIGIHDYWMGASHVTPHYRNHGIFQRMARLALAHYHQQGIDQVFCQIRMDNFPSLKATYQIVFRQLHRPDLEAKLKSHDDQAFIISAVSTNSKPGFSAKPGS
jgi:GNAT superfamily N-acetyltransferase